MSERSQLSQLRQQIAQNFNEEELRTLCFDLGLDYDDLGARGKTANVRELVAYCGRHNRIQDLIAVVKEARPEIGWKSLFPPPNLPFGRNPNFTGREELLDQLHRSLTARETTLGVAAITQAIAGLGGVGKTQLALEYCHRHHDDYDLIWWLRADEEPALAADMVQLGRELGLAVNKMTEQAAQVALVRRWLEGCEFHWLLVFDNADTIAPKKLQAYLPRTGQGRMLITSRSPNWRGMAQVLELNVFTPQEAAEFLVERIGRNEVQEEVGFLAEELGYLPLALEHAGAYVETTGCTLADYRRLLATQRARLWEKAKAPDAYHATITTTWEISFQRVQAKNPAAIALFNLCCFLAPEEIPLPLLREHRETLPEELAALLADELALNEAIGELRRYTFLQRDEAMLAVHRLVQTVARDRMGEARAKIWAEAAVAILNAAWPFDSQDMITWEACPGLLPHLIAALEQVGIYKIATERAAILNGQVDFYIGFFGDLPGALPFSKRALAINEKALGPDHPDTAQSLNNLGYLLQALGNLAEARPYYERALAIREKALGPDHPDLAYSLNNLGMLLQADGNLVGAYANLERAYNIFAQKLGEGHSNTQVVKQNLAAVAASLGRSGL